MKKFIILAIFLGLASNSGLAMKREREEGPAEEGESKESRVEQAGEGLQALEERIQSIENQFQASKTQFLSEGIVLNVPNEEILQVIEFIKTNNFQGKYPIALTAFDNRIFVQCNDGVIRHVSAVALNQMKTMKDLLGDRIAPVTLADPLPVPNMSTPQFMALYQIAINYFAQSKAKNFAQLSTDAKIQNLHVPLQHILHRSNFTATDLLIPAFYLSLPEPALDALARETAIEIKKYKKAFPAFTHIEMILAEKEPGIVYTEFLPNNVKTLSKDILASVMRQFFLINPKETQPRLVSKCYDQNDLFCIKTLQFDLPMKPFSIAELLEHKKIIMRNNLLDLRHMNINDAVGFENIPGLDQITWLLLANNRLHQLPANFLNNCSQLQTLMLFDNQLQELPANFLNNCPQLQKLALYKNRLQQLPTNFLHNCPQLQLLHLQNNQLPGLPANFLNNCPQLQFLMLNNNQLRELPANFLNNYAQLQMLFLENNQLQQLPANFLNNCSQLLVLGLFNNQLSSEAIEQIKETLLRQGKVVDGKNIILEPQKMETKQEKTNE